MLCCFGIAQGSTADKMRVEAYIAFHQISGNNEEKKLLVIYEDENILRWMPF